MKRTIVGNTLVRNNIIVNKNVKCLSNVKNIVKNSIAKNMIFMIVGVNNVRIYVFYVNEIKIDQTLFKINVLLKNIFIRQRESNILLQTN